MAELKERKEKLEEEIRSLENGFETRITNVKSGILKTAHPTEFIKSNPLKSMAVAAAAGFTIGLLRRGKRSRSYSQKKSNPRNGIPSILKNELKHLAVQKAMYYISDLIDQQISGRKKSTSEEK